MLSGPAIATHCDCLQRNDSHLECSEQTTALTYLAWLTIWLWIVGSALRLLARLSLCRVRQLRRLSPVGGALLFSATFSRPTV
jgi:hypothetical protein